MQTIFAIFCVCVKFQFLVIARTNLTRVKKSPVTVSLRDGTLRCTYNQYTVLYLCIYLAILFDTFADVFFRALFFHKFRWRKTRVFFFFYLLFSFLKRHSLALLFAVVGVPGHGAFLYSKAEDRGRKLQVLTNGSKPVGRERGVVFFVSITWGLTFLLLVGI